MLIDYLQAVCLALGREAEMESGRFCAAADGKDRFAEAKTSAPSRSPRPIPAVVRRRLRVLREPLA